MKKGKGQNGQGEETGNPLEIFKGLGVLLDIQEGSNQATGVCPFCGREKKLYVNINKGLWDCKICAATGNGVSFLQQLWKRSDEATQINDLKTLATDRKLLYPETLTYWGVAKSFITNQWIIPGYGAKGTITQLYRYLRIKDNGQWKNKLLPTPGLKAGEAHGIHGVGLYDPKKPIVYLCEGWGDGMILWELLRSLKQDDAGNLVPTGAESNSLLARANVLAIPSCNVFQNGWLPLFENKHVVMLFDSDHPKEIPGTTIKRAPAGLEGMKRIAGKLISSEHPPSGLQYLKWGEEGYDPTKPDDYDIRDHLSQGKTAQERAKALKDLFSRIVDIPTEWVPGTTKKGHKNGSTTLEIECLPCESWRSLTNAFRKALKWTEGLDRGMSVMLSCILSTETPGDQLWVKIIGPPSCGKTELCEAVSVNKEYCVPKSVIRGFHSGYKTDREGEEDHSLIPILRGKTLITKDGDTLLQSPNRDQILAEARDLYDRNSRTHYRHKVNRDYEGIPITWILCGTESLRILDKSELGERFLDCEIVGEMDISLEREIALRKARLTFRQTTVEADSSTALAQDGPEKLHAKQLTGGYIDYLKGNAKTLFDKVEESDETLQLCVYLGEFVSFARARPSTKQEEKAQRELCFRLTSQIAKLSKCMAVVLNKTTIDKEVMRRVRACALDTARGRTIEIIRRLAETDREGLVFETIAGMTGEDGKELRTLLRFLVKIKAIEFHHKEARPGLRGQPRYRLTERLQFLYREIMKDA